MLAYTINSKPPVPYRLQSSTFRLHVPEIKLSSIFSSIRFFTVMQQTATWRLISQLFSKLRTWTRRVIWGDRVCHTLHFLSAKRLIYVSYSCNFMGPQRFCCKAGPRSCPSHSRRKKSTSW